MRNLLNTAWHFLAEKLEKDVNISKEELKVIADKTEAISSELKDWVGEGEHELISIGQNCNTSWYIKDTGQKIASYPFDWIFTSADILVDILNDDFQKLLDSKLIIPKGFRAGHKVYHSFQYGHRNPATSKSDLDYYHRCIDRWHQMMEEKRPVVFVYTVLNEGDKRPDYTNGFDQEIAHPGIQKLEHFSDLIALIKTKNPNAKLLFVEQYTEQNFNLEIQEKSDDVCWLRFDSLGSNTGVKYPNPIDDQVMKSVYSRIGNKD